MHKRQATQKTESKWILSCMFFPDSELQLRHVQEKPPMHVTVWADPKGFICCNSIYSISLIENSSGVEAIGSCRGTKGWGKYDSKDRQYGAGWGATELFLF